MEENKIKVKDIISFMIVIVLAVLFVVFVAQRTRVVGSSMEPTYHDGDQLIVNKILYRFSKPKRNDVIVFEMDDERHLIKRVKGLPGDTVQVKDGSIYINGKIQKEEFPQMDACGSAATPLTLGKDEYFVLGDNRNHSSDSREFGPVKKKQITGKAWIRIWKAKKRSE